MGFQISFRSRRRQRASGATWERALPEIADRLGWPLKKGFVNGKMSISVPPDDLIQLTRKNVMAPSGGGMLRTWYERLVLIVKFEGDWKASVVVRARHEPGVLLTIGAEPITFDDPHRPWVAEGRDLRATQALLAPSIAEAIDRVWDPTMWIAVKPRRGKVLVVVGTENGDATADRLVHMVALTRDLVQAAQQLPQQGIGTQG